MKQAITCGLLYSVLQAKFIACFLLLTCAFSSPAQEMAVEDAIRLGLKNNYDIQIARYSAQIAANDKGKGTANFLPVIDVGSSFRYDASNKTTGSPLSFGNSDTRTWASQLSLSWTVFDGFRMFADKKRFDELARLGEFQARDIIERTAVTIMRAFFDLVQQEQLLDVFRSTRNVSKTRVQREEVRHSLGGASSTDLLNAKVNLNNDESTLLDQQLAVTIARKQLNIVLARDPLKPVVVKKEITIPDFDMKFDEMLAIAKEQNSTLRVARTSKQVAEENVRIANSAFWPRLTLNGSYGYTDRSLLGDDIMPATDRSSHAIDASVGLVLTFNLFNGNIDKINMQNTRLEALNQELNLKNIENEIAGLVQEKHVTFQKQIAKVRLEEQNTVTARQNMELQKERYATGAADSLDFRDAQVNLNRAQTTLIVARFQARIALLELQQLTGTITID